MNEFTNVEEEDQKIIKDLMEVHNYDDLKDTQIQAFNEGALEPKNQLLIAETGNGKTLCAEAVAKKKLEKGKRVAYLVPSTQLVRDKKETINEWGADIEVTTGSGKYYHGDVIVATFSSFYQAIIRGVGDVRDFDVAILDDFHELYGGFIGPGLEKSIAAIKQYEIDIFSMSATIGNPNDISEWLDANLIISDEKRNIPIEENIGTSKYSSKKEAVGDLVARISDKKPVLVFNYAKSWCKSRAQNIAKKTEYDEPEIDIRDEIQKRLGETVPNSLDPLVDLINNGVAYHHSGLPKNIREFIEDLYQENKIQCICATTTIAYGFDAPVQTVVVADMKRRGTWVGKWEYQQWIGRAARPGFGYDKGYAYIITRNPNVVQNEFFEPRQLEPIETHINTPNQFRKLILELIAMGWDTPEDIEEFLEETLLWNSLSTSGSWGRSFDDKRDQMIKKLRETANWLESHNFIIEDRTSRSFNATDKGTSSVEFLFSINKSVSLSDIDRFYTWLNKEDKIDKFACLCRVCDIFSISLNKKQATKKIKSHIRNSGNPVNRNTITASIIDRLWISNYDYEEIENRTDANTAYLSNITYRASNILDESSELIDDSKNIPQWYNHYPYRIKRGIEMDTVPYVRNVRGLGRSKVRALVRFLNNIDEINRSDSLYKKIEVLRENKENINNMINSNVDGFGENITSRLYEYHNTNNVPKVFRDNQKTGDTTLKDF